MEDEMIFRTAGSDDTIFWRAEIDDNGDLIICANRNDTGSYIVAWVSHDTGKLVRTGSVSPDLGLPLDEKGRIMLREEGAE